MRMERRFFWGDLLACVVVGVAAAVAGLALARSPWPLGLSLLAGALSGLLIDVVFFSRWLGAMETMFPTLLSGMMAGLVGALLDSFTAGWAGMAGAGVGLAVFAALALLQAHIVAQARRGIWS